MQFSSPGVTLITSLMAVSYKKSTLKKTTLTNQSEVSNLGRNGHEITLTFGADVCLSEASSAAENVKVISSPFLIS